MWPNEKFLNELGCKDELNFTEPLYTWTPSIIDGAIAPSQGIHYKNDYFKRFKNNILIGSLAATSLFRMKFNEQFSIINVERINVNERIRDLTALNSGEILLYTDGGSIVLLSMKEKL